MGEWRKCSCIHLASSPPFNRRSNSWDKAFGSDNLQAGKGEQMLYIQAMLSQHFQCSSSCCLNGETIFTTTSRAAETASWNNKDVKATELGELSPKPCCDSRLNTCGNRRPDFPWGSSRRRKVDGSQLDVMWGENTSPFCAGGRAKADVLISPQGSRPGKH